MSTNSGLRSMLPVVTRRVLWHNEAGMIVTVFNRPLPLEISIDSLNNHTENIKAKLLPDKDIYYGFYPRQPMHTNPLFAELDLSDSDLHDQIVKCASGWQLKQTLVDAWVDIQNFLTRIGDTLIDRHSDTFVFPLLSKPPFPTALGFCDAHESKEKAFKVAKRSKAAFPLLSAYVSFALSLWLSPFKDTAFDEAFKILSDELQLTPATLAHLKESVIFDLSPHLRPGFFLDAYMTRWGRFLYKIGRSGVPIWLIWGKDEMFKRLTESATVSSYYFPPQEHIEKAKRLLVPYNQPKLPLASTYQPPGSGEFSFPADEPSNDFEIPSPPSTPPPNNADFPASFEVLSSTLPPKGVHPKSRQRVGESWESFKVRNLEGLESCKQNETPQERTSRQSREAYAKEVNEKGKRIARRSKVFEWVEDDYHRGYYIRTPLKDHEDDFEDYTEHQRVYWSHRDEWDFVRHIPEYPQGFPEEKKRQRVEDIDDIDDPRWNPLHSKPPPKVTAQIAHQASENILKSIRERASSRILTSEYTRQYPSFLRYLQLRHGFDVNAMHNDSRYLHNLHSQYNVKAGDWKAVVKRLLYSTAFTDGEPHSTPLIDFQNTAQGILEGSQVRVNIDELPPNWDLKGRVFLEKWSGLVMLQIVTASPDQHYNFECQKTSIYEFQPEASAVEPPKTDLYILRPSTQSLDKSSWFIATTDPTTVLYVFRRNLETMTSIARALLEEGIPFRTVEERPANTQTREAGEVEDTYHTVREKGFVPTQDDYYAYVESRTKLLKSTSGRSIRTRGGIVGRLAAEVVADVEVFEGPTQGDEMVGYDDKGKVFVDDFVSVGTMELVAGVYRVAGESSRTNRISWWPTQVHWQACGLNADFWSPDAEDWYVTRTTEMNNGKLEVKSWRDWKRTTKKVHNHLIGILRGSRNLSSQAIASLATQSTSKAGPSSSSSSTS
ncbi:hypothetical protein CPB83DRAFT_865534 [Crepidotus variabilis]|uniref:Uncharacterized protein n=1 Tax=Crepidotus variabilis TaxID=179855 RepID=A0A9P6E084_9AGAR|nr:hypothetical protein CPB83DRAFT_865534 [Crepidotus variabilis]